MNRTLFTLLIILVFATFGFGQEPTSLASRSAVPDVSRYEIIQPNFDDNRMPTFRLDKLNGTVSRLASCPRIARSGSGMCWKEMTVIDQPKTTANGQPHYQIYFSGGSNPVIFLLNIDSGQTWQYGVEGFEKWSPFAEP